MIFYQKLLFNIDFFDKLWYSIRIIFISEDFKMDMLKKFFPFSFKAKNNVAALVINLILYIVIGAVIGIVIGLLAAIPLVGIIIGIVGGLIDLYVLIGIVLSILDYLKVLK